MVRTSMVRGRGIAVTLMRVLLSGFVGVFALAATSLLHAAPNPQFTQEKPVKRGPDLVKVTMATDANTVGPGEQFHLVLEFTIEPEWHIYWKNTGNGGGVPTTIEVTDFPEGFEVGAPIFSRPQRLGQGEEIIYGYEKRAVIVLPVTAPKQMNVATARFEGTVSFLVCKDACRIGGSSFTMDVATKSEPTQQDTSLEALGQKLDISFPKPIKDMNGASATFDGSTLDITVPAPSAEAAFFMFPHDHPGVNFGEPKRLNDREGALHVTVPVEVVPDDSLGEPMRVAGVIALGKELTDPCFEFDLPAIVSDARPADASE